MLLALTAEDYQLTSEDVGLIVAYHDICKGHLRADPLLSLMVQKSQSVTDVVGRAQGFFDLSIMLHLPDHHLGTRVLGSSMQQCLQEGFELLLKRLPRDKKGVVSKYKAGFDG